MIEHLQLAIVKMKREKFGPCFEHGRRLLDQLELQLEDLASAAGEDKAMVAERVDVQVQGFVRRAARRYFPKHLPRRRVIHPAPTCCPCCGSTRPSKIGRRHHQDARYRAATMVRDRNMREKFSCRACEKISRVRGGAIDQWIAAREPLAARRKDVAPLVDDLIAWMTRERAKLSRHTDVARAMDLPAQARRRVHSALVCARPTPIGVVQTSEANSLSAGRRQRFVGKLL